MHHTSHLVQLPSAIEGIVVDLPASPFAGLSLDDFLSLLTDKPPRHLRKLAKLARQETDPRPGDSEGESFCRIAQWIWKNRPDRLRRAA
jgi:hypothetical protein